MSIRYRFFLVVGLLSTIVIAATFFVENITLNRSLRQARGEIDQLYDTLREKRREHLLETLQTGMAKEMAQVNALLEGVSQYAPLAAWFAPTEENLAKGTWNNAATLLQSDDWIHFLQNTVGDRLMSVIVPQINDFFGIDSIPIEEGLRWIYPEGLNGHITPYLGVSLPIKLADPTEDKTLSFIESGMIPDVYVFYDWEKMHSMENLSQAVPDEELDSSVLRIPFLQRYELDEAQFHTWLNRAIDLAKKGQLHPPQPTPKEKQPFPILEENADFKRRTEWYLKQRVEYSNELYLIWQASALYEIGAFGRVGSSFHLPAGMSFFIPKTKSGQGFLLDPILKFFSPVFKDKEYFQSHLPLQPHLHVASGTAIIPSPHPNQLFLGNTASLYGEEGEDANKSSLLTIGFAVNTLLEELVLSFHKYGFVFSDGKVQIGLKPDGGRIEALDGISDVLSKLTMQNSGEIEWQGVSYYFIRMQPAPELDLHFFLITETAEEFALVNNFEEQIAKISMKMSFHIRVIEVAGILLLLLLLLDLSKKITSPIVALSHSLRQAKTGDWEQVKIPRVSFRKGNEIRQLYDSFTEMVEGLKEKEKVKGILNKVVSAEIAKEIMKGDVALGGEERVVTILFADIRNFTFLTQNMAPQEVIELLNTCMTKLSEAIDFHHGVIDKYIGDGIMAIYGAPIAFTESPKQAVLSSLSMLKKLETWNAERKKAGLFPIEIGIGIHTGPACVGNMGASNRLNYTVIGSNVNLASRLCYAAKANEILISEDTWKQPSVSENVVVEDRGEMNFKGFDLPKRVFQVIGMKS